MTNALRRHVFVFAFGCAAALAGLTTSAVAQGTVAQREACEGDAFKFCSEFIPFVAQIENCLFRNMKKLTPACQFQMRGGNASAKRR